MWLVVRGGVIVAEGVSCCELVIVVDTLADDDWLVVADMLPVRVWLGVLDILGVSDSLPETVWDADADPEGEPEPDCVVDWDRVRIWLDERNWLRVNVPVGDGVDMPERVGLGVPSGLGDLVNEAVVDCDELPVADSVGFWVSDGRGDPERVFDCELDPVGVTCCDGDCDFVPENDASCDLVSVMLLVPLRVTDCVLDCERVADDDRVDDRDCEGVASPL